MTPFEIQRFRSLLPVDAIVKNGRPGIEWVDMSGVALSEPFFNQTVERVRKTRPEAQPLVTDLDALIQLEKTSESLQPTGFILHSSRCGSTLVANACRALNDSLVVAEAPAIDKLISRFFTDTDEDGTKELLYSVFVRGAVNALGQRRFGNERHYFVKFACTSTLQFTRIRKIWPNVRSVFLYRHPLEVIVSNMRSVPEWMRESNPATAAAIIGVSQRQLAAIAPEEFCARALGRYYSAAEAMADEKTLLLDYDELTPQALLRLVRFFGVEPSTEEIEAVCQTASFYSKDPTRTQTFEDDRESKRAVASEYIKEMAAKWAMPSYQRLTKLRRANYSRNHSSPVNRKQRT